MKLRTIFLALSAMALMSGCSGNGNGEDNPQPPQPEGIASFKAFYVEPVAKTSLRSTGEQVWNPGDSISLFAGSGMNGGLLLTSNNTEESSSAEFIPSSPVAEKPVYMALHPYSAEASSDGTSLQFTLPSERVAGEFGSGRTVFPLAAMSEDDVLAFYNILGALRVSVVKEGVRTIVVRSKGEEPAAGQVKVAFGASGVPETSFMGGLRDSVAFSSPSPEGFVPGTEYLLPLPPQNYSSGIEITFRTDEEYAVRSIGSSVNVVRSRCLAFLEADAKCEYESLYPEPEPEPEHRTPPHDVVPVTPPEVPEGFYEYDLSKCTITTNNPMQYVTWNYNPDGGWEGTNMAITDVQAEYRRGMYDQLANMWDNDAATCFHTNFDVYSTGSSWSIRSGALVKDNEIIIHFPEKMSGRFHLFMVNPVNGFFMGYTVAPDHDHAFIELQCSSNGYSWYDTNKWLIQVPGSTAGMETYLQDIVCTSLPEYSYIRIAPHAGETSSGTFSGNAGFFGLAELRLYFRIL